MDFDVISPPPTTITRARIIRTTDIGVGPLVDIAISWEAAQFDNGNMWNIANPTRLTIPSTGVWVIVYGLLTLQGGLPGVGTGPVMRLQLNGVTYIAQSRLHDYQATGQQEGAVNTSIYQFNASDYIEARTIEVSANGFTVLNDGGQRTFLAAALIGV